MVREHVWRWMRDQRILRRIYSTKAASAIMRWVSNRLVPGDHRSVVRVRDGLGMGLAFRLFPRWEWAVWNGTYEAEVQLFLDELLRPGVVFYDIGGGMGFFTCCAARRGAQVFVFEPDNANAECLESHLRMNRLTKQVTVERKAVFSHSGRVRLMPPAFRHSHGNAVVDDRGLGMAVSTTLDDYCLEHPPPGVCKVDVEGAESNVLQGAERLFETCRPAVVMEVHDETNADFAQHFFARKGYSLQWFSERPGYPKHFKASPNEAGASAGVG
jgi:FkbM family methyltransferase